MPRADSGLARFLEVWFVFFCLGFGWNFVGVNFESIGIWFDPLAHGILLGLCWDLVGILGPGLGGTTGNQ